MWGAAPALIILRAMLSCRLKTAAISADHPVYIELLWTASLFFYTLLHLHNPADLDLLLSLIIYPLCHNDRCLLLPLAHSNFPTDLLVKVDMHHHNTLTSFPMFGSALLSSRSWAILTSPVLQASIRGVNWICRRVNNYSLFLVLWKRLPLEEKRLDLLPLKAKLRRHSLSHWKQLPSVAVG